MKNIFKTAALLITVCGQAGAASNEETLEYIISDYQYQCEKAQEDFRDVDYEEGDPVVAELPVECFAKAGERTYEHDHQGFTC